MHHAYVFIHSFNKRFEHLLDLRPHLIVPLTPEKWRFLHFIDERLVERDTDLHKVMWPVSAGLSIFLHLCETPLDLLVTNFLSFHLAKNFFNL